MSTLLFFLYYNFKGTTGQTNQMKALFLSNIRDNTFMTKNPKIKNKNDVQTKLHKIRTSNPHSLLMSAKHVQKSFQP